MVFVVENLVLTLRVFSAYIACHSCVVCTSYSSRRQFFCSFPHLLPPPFFSPFFNFSCRFRDLFRSCVATSEVTKFPLGPVILNFFSVGSRWVGVHVLVFRSELCILLCCFLSNTQDLLLYVRLQCHCAIQLRMFPYCACMRCWNCANVQAA